MSIRATTSMRCGAAGFALAALAGAAGAQSIAEQFGKEVDDGAAVLDK